MRFPVFGTWAGHRVLLEQNIIAKKVEYMASEAVDRHLKGDF